MEIAKRTPYYFQAKSHIEKSYKKLDDFTESLKEQHEKYELSQNKKQGKKQDDLDR